MLITLSREGIVRSGKKFDINHAVVSKIQPLKVDLIFFFFIYFDVKSAL